MDKPTCHIGDIGKKDIEDRILYFLEDGPKTTTQILRLFSSHLSAATLNDHLAKLMRDNLVVSEKVKTKGRPSIYFSLSTVRLKRST